MSLVVCANQAVTVEALLEIPKSNASVWYAVMSAAVITFAPVKFAIVYIQIKMMIATAIPIETLGLALILFQTLFAICLKKIIFIFSFLFS
jgi:hypothetical protein